MLRNLSGKTVKMPAKTIIGEVSPCNVVPPIWKPESSDSPVVVQTEESDQTWTKEVEGL